MNTNRALKVVAAFMAVLSIWSCAKKSTPSTSSTTPQSVQTNPNTYFTVDGTPANQPNSAGSVNSANSTYVVTGIDYSGYPQITITFPHSTIPTSGTYSIVTTNPNAGVGLKCNFLLTQIGNYTATATSGTVSISTASTHSYEVIFNNMSCTGSYAGTHVVSGTIGY